MNKKWRMNAIATGIAAIAGVTLSSASFALPPPPKAGDLINSSADRLGSWSIFERGFWCKALDENCSYALLNNGTDIIVAITKPTSIGPRGGYEQEVITSTFLITAARSEKQVDCGHIAGRDSVISLLNRRAKTIRTFYMEDGHLASQTLKYKAKPPCDVGEN